VSRLFSAYVIVDWSAASKPTTGADSVWIGVLKRDVRFRLTFESYNPATRGEAETKLAAVLDDLKKRGERALVGFDFPLGFPRGLSQALSACRARSPLARGLGPAGQDGQGQGRQHQQPLRRRLRDQPPPDRRPLPVLGLPAQGRPDHPAAQATRASTAPATCPSSATRTEAAQRRALDLEALLQRLGRRSGDRRHPGRARLKDARGDAVRVWPFETGFKALTEADLDGVAVVVAEVYPSLLKSAPRRGEIKDLAQVRSLAEHFAKLDEAGKLGAALRRPAQGFCPIPAVAADAATEEGWILGPPKALCAFVSPASDPASPGS
jgi:hypothetical protein